MILSICSKLKSRNLSSGKSFLPCSGLFGQLGMMPFSETCSILCNLAKWSSNMNLLELNSELRRIFNYSYNYGYTTLCNLAYFLCFFFFCLLKAVLGKLCLLFIIKISRGQPLPFSLKKTLCRVCIG